MCKLVDLLSNITKKTVKECIVITSLTPNHRPLNLRWCPPHRLQYSANSSGTRLLSVEVCQNWRCQRVALSDLGDIRS